jgi:hypothetical protein
MWTKLKFGDFSLRVSHHWALITFLEVIFSSQMLNCVCVCAKFWLRTGTVDVLERIDIEGRAFSKIQKEGANRGFRSSGPRESTVLVFIHIELDLYESKFW